MPMSSSKSLMMLPIFWLITLVTCQKVRLSLPDNVEAAACVDFLNTIYRFGSCASSNSTCLCASDAFMPTAISCINQAVQLTGGQSNETSLSQNGLKKMCKSNSSSYGEFFNQSFAISPLSADIAEQKPGSRKVSKPFKPTATEISNALKSYTANNEASDRNDWLGSALLGYWLGFFVLHTMCYWLNTYFYKAFRCVSGSVIGRWFRVYVGLPNTNTYFPPVIYSFMIFGFTVISMVFSFAYLPNPTSTNYKYVYNGIRAYGTTCGIRTGFLPIYVMPLMILFAGRNNFLQYFTGMSQDLFISLHRWVARIVVILVLIHSFAFTAAFAARGTYGAVWARAYWKWGIVGTAFGCYLCFQAARMFRSRAYETFLVCHIIGSIFFLVGGYWHLKNMHASEGVYFYYASFAVWGFERFLRILRIMFGKVGQQATIKSYGDILIITAELPSWWKVPKSPGLYAYIHFLNYKTFWQSHPFTIIHSYDNPNELRLVVRAKSGITKQLVKAAEANGGEIKMPIALDGPYGHSANLKSFENLVFVAGGVGLTAPFAHIQHLLRNNFTERITFFWAVRDSSYREWFNEEIEYLRDHANVDVRIFNSDGLCGPSASASGSDQADSSSDSDLEKKQNLEVNSNSGCETNALLNVHDEVLNTVMNSSGDTAVFCCGPEGINLGARNAVISALKNGNGRVEYFEESFSW